MCVSESAVIVYFGPIEASHSLPRCLLSIWTTQEAYSYYLKNRPSVAQSNFWSELPLQLRLKLVNDRFYREIQAVRLFRDGDAEFVSQLIVRSKPYRVSAGQLIHDVGDIAEEITFILEGSVRITVPGFTDVLVGCGTVGGYFGELEFFKTSTRTARYVAVHDCTLLGIEFSCLSAAVEDNPAAGSEFLAEIEHRYTVFQEISKAMSLTGSCAAGSRSVFIKGEGPTVTASTAPTASATPADPSSLRSRRGSRSRTPRKTSLSLSADLFSGAFRKMEGKEDPSVDHRLFFAGQLSNNGQLSEAQSMDEVQASIFSKTTSAIRYRVLMLDRDGLERTGEMTPNELGCFWFVHPRDVRKNKWDVFLGILVIYSVLNTPIQLAFATYQPGTWPAIVDLLIDVFFFLDLLLNFNMVYFSDPASAYVAVRWRIMKRYLRSWFFVDLLSFFPLSECLIAVMGSDGTSDSNLDTIQLVKSFRLFRLLKLFHSVNISKTLSVLEESFNINANALSLGTTILQVLLISHMVSCLWWGLSSALSSSTWYDDTAMVYNSLRLASFRDQYIASLYFSVTTLTTTGYGDILPVNNEERIVAIFVMVVGASVFGYVVANVAVLVTGSSLLEVLASRRVNILKEFLTESKCNSHLSAEVINHFLQASKVTHSTDANAVYDKLPTSIRDEILFNVNRDTLDHIPLFRHITNLSVKLYLLSLMTVKVGAAGRCLIKSGKSGSEIFFLVEGDASIYQVLDGCSKQQQRTRASSPVRSESVAAGLISRLGSSLLHLRRKSAKDRVGGVKSSEEPQSTYPNRYARIKRVENISDFKTLTTRRSIAHHLSSKKRLRARFNWRRVKALIPSIAAIGRKLKEDEDLASARLHLIGSLHAGEFIGHREIMRGETHAYTVIASTACKYYTLHSDAVVKLLAEHPDIALQLQSALGCSIYCENQTTALKTFREREEAFQRVARDYSTIAKLNSFGPNISAPRTVTSALSVFVGMLRRLFGSVKGRCDERDHVLGVKGDEEAGGGKEKRTLVRHRRSIQNGLDSPPTIAATRRKSSKELTVERHYDATSSTPLPGTGTGTGTGTDPPPKNISDAPGARDAFFVSISACTTTSAFVSRTFSLRLRQRTSQRDAYPTHLLNLCTQKRRWSASSTIDNPLGVISPESFLAQNCSPGVQGHGQHSWKEMRRFSI
jgi:CRP-like cAMP-binding protein